MRWINLEPIIESEISLKEKNKYHILSIYTESRKMVLKNLFAGQQWRNRHREQTHEHREKAGEGEMYGKSNMETYITICKTDSQLGICCMAQETQTGVLYQSRGVGWVDGREVQKGGDIYVYLCF